MRVNHLSNIKKKHDECMSSTYILDVDKMFDLLDQEERDIIINEDFPKTDRIIYNISRKVRPRMQELEIESMLLG